MPAVDRNVGFLLYWRARPCLRAHRELHGSQPSRPGDPPLPHGPLACRRFQLATTIGILVAQLVNYG